MAKSGKYVVYTHDCVTDENWYFGTYGWEKAWEQVDLSVADERYHRLVCCVEDAEEYKIKNMPR